METVELFTQIVTLAVLGVIGGGRLALLIVLLLETKTKKGDQNRCHV